MPKIAGVNALGVLLAALGIYVIGILWFGILFQELWITSNGYTLEKLEANFSPVLVYGGGVLIPLILAFAIGWLLKVTGTKGLQASLLFGLKLGLFIVGPLMAYGYVYNETPSLTAFLLDFSHSLVGFIVGAGILSYFE